MQYRKNLNGAAHLLIAYIIFIIEYIAGFLMLHFFPATLYVMMLFMQSY